MNYTPYDGDASFLEGPTEATNKLWGKLQALQKEERAKGGVLDMETEVVTSLIAFHRSLLLYCTLSRTLRLFCIFINTKRYRSGSSLDNLTGI